MLLAPAQKHLGEKAGPPRGAGGPRHSPMLSPLRVGCSDWLSFFPLSPTRVQLPPEKEDVGLATPSFLRIAALFSGSPRNSSNFSSNCWSSSRCEAEPSLMLLPPSLSCGADSVQQRKNRGSGFSDCFYRKQGPYNPKIPLNGADFCANK